MKKFKFLSLMIVLFAFIVSGCSGGGKYYKNREFITDDTLEVTFETTDKSIHWGEFQKEANSLGDDCDEIHAALIPASNSKEEFDEKVKLLKDRLDALESEYEFGYSGDDGNIITIKIGNKKIGLPVFAIFNADRVDDIKIVSTMNDLEISSLTSASYKINGDKVETSVEIPETDREKLKNYINDNAGEYIYLKIGELTYSELVITEDTPSDKLTFTGFAFLGSESDETKYEFIAKLATYVINNMHDGKLNMNFGTEVEENDVYGVPYVTKTDENVIENIKTLYSDVRFIRDSVKNKITLHFEGEMGEIAPAEAFEKIQAIYEICKFDDGAYSVVSFTWAAGDVIGKNDFVYFEKIDGKMVCHLWSDKIEEDVKNNAFLKSYMEQ